MVKSFLTKLQSRAFAPIDIASLVFFRIAFGLLMAWEVCRYFRNGWIYFFWLEPRILFKYYGFSWVLVPANRTLSVDAWLRPSLRLQSAPAWSLWLLRFQIGVVYFFAGLVKLSPDWLRGEPMRYQLSHATNAPIVSRLFREEWAVYAVSYGGLLFDLFVVPLLLWRRTRVR